MRILVLHPGALGDIILSLPALHLLKTHLPEARLTLAGNSDFILAAAAGYADHFLSLGELPLHRLYASEEIAWEDLGFWRSFHRILAWTGSGDEQFVDRLRWANPQSLVRRWRPDPDDSRHVSQIFAESLAPWIQLPTTLDYPEIVIPPADLHEADLWLGRVFSPRSSIVAIHPGAGGTVKRWPLDRYRSLMGEILSDGDTAVVLIEGPAEPGLAEDLAGAWPPSRAAAASSLPLKNLAAILCRCRAFVGNDSGVAHLAAALGIRTVVLFGPTNPGQWAPRGPQVRMLWSPDGCGACLERAPSGHTCLESITVKQVRAALREWLAPVPER